jgi:hypothetical protein
LYFGRSHSYSFFTRVFFTRELAQRGVWIVGFGHFSPPLQAFWHSWQGCLQVSQSSQRRPGSSGQNSSHLTSQQYFFTFSVPHTNWHVRCVQQHSLPHWAHLSAEPQLAELQLAGPQEAAPQASSATARAANKESDSVRNRPIIFMLMFSLIRPPR